MFSVNPGAILGLIIFTVLIQKSEGKKIVESPKGLSETFAYWTSLESSGFPSGLRPSGKSDKSREFLRIFFPESPYGLLTVCTKV